MKVIKMVFVGGLVATAAFACGSSSTDATTSTSATSATSATSSTTSSGAGGGGGGSSCVNCGTAVFGMKDPKSVCEKSMAVYTAFTACTCMGKCMTACADSCTNPDAGASAGCQGCVFTKGDMGCGDELNACNADK
jgi:hypothetical protein